MARRGGDLTGRVVVGWVAAFGRARIPRAGENAFYSYSNELALRSRERELEPRRYTIGMGFKLLFGISIAMRETFARFLFPEWNWNSDSSAWTCA